MTPRLSYSQCIANELGAGAATPSDYSVPHCSEAQIVGNPSETREAKEKKDEAKEPGSLAGLGDLCGEHGFANQPARRATGQVTSKHLSLPDILCVQDMRPAPNAAAPLQDRQCDQEILTCDSTGATLCLN